MFDFICIKHSLEKCTGVSYDKRRIIKDKFCQNQCNENLCDYNNGICQPKVECMTNEDCLSENCVNNKCEGEIVICNAGNGKIKCALDIGENCNNNSECMSERCLNGQCGPEFVPTFSSIPIVTFFGTIGILTFIAVYYKIKKRSIIWNKNDKGEKLLDEI